jgi:hypothetical protein
MRNIKSKSVVIVKLKLVETVTPVVLVEAEAKIVVAIIINPPLKQAMN